MNTPGDPQTPVRVSFQNGNPSESVLRMIVEQAEALERLYGRPTYCHVVVKVPDHHRRSDSLYEISIYLTMPGHFDICVDNTSPPDSRCADPQFAVSEAFRRARCLVAESHHHRRGDAKPHERRTSGSNPRAS